MRPPRSTPPARGMIGAVPRPGLCSRSMQKRRRPIVSGKGSQMTRAVPVVEVRALDDKGRFEARVLRYNVRDDYNTEFAPGLFAESLAAKLPRIAWGHDWREVIGLWVEWRDDGEYLVLTGQLDLAMIDVYAADGETIINRMPAVPLAHQAYAQLKSGSIAEFSVGFIPIAWEDIQDEDGDYYRRFTKGRLDEVSLVLAGAVPGTSLLSLRSVPLHNVREPLVAKEKVAALLLRLHGGEVDLADALRELKALPAEGDDGTDPAAGLADGETDDDDDEVIDPPASDTGAVADLTAPVLDSDGNPIDPPAATAADADGATLDPPAASETDPDEDDEDDEFDADLAEALAILENV